MLIDIHYTCKSARSLICSSIHEARHATNDLANGSWGTYMVCCFLSKTRRGEAFLQSGECANFLLSATKPTLVLSDLGGCTLETGDTVFWQWLRERNTNITVLQFRTEETFLLQQEILRFIKA